MITARILLLGSESWVNEATVKAGLTDAAAMVPLTMRVALVRNSYANGAPKMAADIWAKWARDFPGEFEEAQLIPPGGDITKNIDLCITFASEGDELVLHDTRLVKAAGIRTIQYGAVAGDTTEAAA